MFIDFDQSYLMVSLENSTAVVLSTCIRVGGWICLSSSSVVRICKASLAFRKVALIYSSADKYMTVFMSWYRVWVAPLLVGSLGSLSAFLKSWSARGKWPPAGLRAHSSQR